MENLSILFLFISLIFTGNLLAKEETLATVTRNDDAKFYALVASVDESNDSIKTFYKDHFEGKSKISRELLSTNDLIDEGLILEKQNQHIVLDLKSENFDHQRGGTITIDTLYSGISGERKEYLVELAKSNNGWKIFKNNKAISNIHFIVNTKPLIGAIGIKDVVMK